jgi:hypothetical protein
MSRVSVPSKPPPPAKVSTSLMPVGSTTLGRLAAAPLAGVATVSTTSLLDWQFVQALPR